MELNAFFDAVENHADLQGVSISNNQADGECLLAVEHLPSKLVTQLPAGAVEASEWDVLEDVLVGNREPQILYHMTRVVGYYSRVENWNQSKVGELTDRHAGNYCVA